MLRTDLALPIGMMLDLLLRLPEEITGQPTTEWQCGGRVVRIVRDRVNGYAEAAVNFEWVAMSREVSQSDEKRTGVESY